MLKPIGLTEGHYECRSLDETLPIFTDLLASKSSSGRKTKQWSSIRTRRGDSSSMKADRTLNKPHTIITVFALPPQRRFQRHTNTFPSHKAQYKIKSVTTPHEAHYAYSIYFKEPGGNDLEIEYYNPAAVKHGRNIAAPHWTETLPEENFPGRATFPRR